MVAPHKHTQNHDKHTQKRATFSPLVTLDVVEWSGRKVKEFVVVVVEECTHRGARRKRRMQVAWAHGMEPSHGCRLLDWLGAH